MQPAPQNTSSPAHFSAVTPEIVTMVANRSVLLFFFILCILTLATSRRRNSKFFDRPDGVPSPESEEDTNAQDVKPRDRRGKLFSLFNVVTFKNDPCTATATTVAGLNRNGTCFSMNECEDRNGMAMGNCAAGFGVCCLFILETGGTTTQVTQNCTYIQNENFPNALPDDPAAVMVTVQKCSNDVCFLRLDFEVFTLLGTGGSANLNEGVCLDTFTVTATPTVAIPVICGVNTGQHMYIDIGGVDGGVATLAFAFDAMNVNRMFDIKVTQLECDNPSAPPEVCLQYLFGLTGRIETFNFNNVNDNHLNSQQYSVCVRQEEGFCCVQYMVCEDQMGPLNNAIVTKTAGFSFDTSIAADISAADDNCVSSDMNSIDHISIPESSGMCNVNAAMSRAIHSRYCGSFLNGVEGLQTNSPVCDCTAPFTVDIFFEDSSDVGIAATNTKQSRGLCLEYFQVAC